MLNEIIEPLLSWYEQNHRVLPWREKKDPYAIWISEIMLQQTRVEAVKPFYERFMTALPTPKELAECPMDRLLKLWEGLGYYNRVRNMQKAAQVLMKDYGGKLPADYGALKSLPGIGNYTAGAIGSIAYEIPVPAVDGNVLRVIMRIREDDSDIMKQSVKKKVEEDLQKIMPEGKSGTLNQALMELGAVVCVPNGAPKCTECPVAHLCLAHLHGTELSLPVKKKPKPRRIEEKTVLLLLDGHRMAVRKRPDHGLLAGMYEFPNVTGHLESEEALRAVESMGLDPMRIRRLPEAKHIFSHVEWHMIGYAVQVGESEEVNESELLFVDTNQAAGTYALPAAFAAYADYVNLKLGQEKYQESNQ